MILVSIDVTKFLVFEFENRTHVALGYLPPSKTKYACCWCHKESDTKENDKTRWHGIWDDVEDRPVFHLLCCSLECDDALGKAIEPYIQALGETMFDSYKESVKVEDVK